MHDHMHSPRGSDHTWALDSFDSNLTFGPACINVECECVTILNGYSMCNALVVPGYVQFTAVIIMPCAMCHVPHAMCHVRFRRGMWHVACGMCAPGAAMCHVPPPLRLAMAGRGGLQVAKLI